jgi:hypothetical protein
VTIIEPDRHQAGPPQASAADEPHGCVKTPDHGARPLRPTSVFGPPDHGWGVDAMGGPDPAPCSDVMGGPDAPGRVDVMGGPERAGRADVMGRPDVPGTVDVMGGPDPAPWTCRHKRGRLAAQRRTGTTFRSYRCPECGAAVS